MNVYLVNASILRFSAKQLEAVSRLFSCPDLGGFVEGVAWVRDNDGDIVILSSEYRQDGFFRLLPRRYDSYHIDVLYRAAAYLTACATDWLPGPSPVKMGWGVTVARDGVSWLMYMDCGYVNQKVFNVNQGKLNISYKEDEQGDSN